MIPQNPAVDLAVRHAKRLSWIALVAGILCVSLAVVGRAFGLPTPWTSWVLAIVLISNPAVYLLSQRWQTFRAAQVYYRIATVVSLVVLVGTIVRLWHR